MKKCQKVLLIIFICYVSYFFVYGIFSLTSLSEEIVGNISLIFWILPAIIYIFIIKRIVKKENNEILKVSEKTQKLVELNEYYNFKKILKRKHSISEREYSRKSLERVMAFSIIKYHIENDIDFLRTDIENAIHNISLLEDYNKDVEKLGNYESSNRSKYSLKKFNRIENRVFKSLVYKKEDFLITLNLEVYYQSNKGNVNESKYSKFTFEDLSIMYNDWVNGNKFKETIKQERKIMNDDIRYNVLKRDNYTCQICGVTVKDGAKLHVDHLIPVSKGGKTVMSNLQTLCDRCNIGKSNKIEDDFKNDMICPKCGSKLVKRKSKYGEFIGCSAYPKCHYKK